MEPKFNITLVQSLIRQRPYTKIDGVYAGPTWRNRIGLQTVNNTPEEVAALMSKLNTAHDMCMVYGHAVAPKIADTDRTMKNFSDEPVHILTLDLDNYVSPNLEKHGREINYNQIREDADHFIYNNLPPEFQNTSYILRLSSSFLVKDTQHFRAHIIFVLAEPQYPREIGTWIKMDGIPADSTFYFNLTQPVFTAEPMWIDKPNPFAAKEGYFPRVNLIKKEKSHVDPGWQPYYVPRRDADSLTGKLPAAHELPGQIGAFCRAVELSKVLDNLGYSNEGDGRYLSPASTTGIPGAIAFANGFCFSHHNDDPINRVISEYYKLKRNCLNAYDLMKGWASINLESDPKLMKEFEFWLNQAVISDSGYQDEIVEELTRRLEWLTEGPYERTNRTIINSVMTDMHDMHVTEMTRDYIFDLIKAKTKQVNKTALKNIWQGMRKERAHTREAYDPDAGLRHMSSLFERQSILFSHHKKLNGDFWCYYKDTRMWRRLNKEQTEAYIYRHIHASLPIKVEIDITKANRLTSLVLKNACESRRRFQKGKGWAFKGGRYGILMDGLFSTDGMEWNPESSVRTLQKTDRIYKQLPFTYEDWLDSRDKVPSHFMDFLVTSCEEDYEKVELLREFMGYILADSYAIHKFLILEGVPGSGKSILSKVIRAIVGHEFYAATSINTLSERFGLGELPGKKVAVMAEARAVDFKKLRNIVPLLLKIVGNDPIDSEAKNKSISTEILECKILIMTNRTPVLPDDTGAIAQRLMMVRFNKSFRGTKDEILGLDSIILQDELPLITRWVLEGLAQLSKRRDFVEPESSRAVKEHFIMQVDPLRIFIRDHFDYDEHDFDQCIPCKDFRLYFRAFMKSIGRPVENKVIEKMATVGKIQSLYPNVKKHRATTANGARPWVFGWLKPMRPLGLEFADEIAELGEVNPIDTGVSQGGPDGRE